MLPMGTIMAVLMLLGVLVANRLPIIGVGTRLPSSVRQIVGGLVAAGGAWNVFWHALRHLSDFWGLMALASGALMLITGVSLINTNWLPPLLQRVRPVVILGLLLFGLFYAWTIYSL